MIAALRRNWDIIATAWRNGREGAAAQQRHGAPAFLPAALEIIETPPSPLGRTLLLGLCAMVVVALLWSAFGRVDVVVVAPGQTLPRARVQIVSWGGPGSGLEGTTGMVRALHVADGDRVRKGQVLVELDPTISGADAAQARRGLASAEIERARSRALVDYLATGRESLTLPPGLSAQEVATQRGLIRSTIAEYEAQAGVLRQMRAERAAELAGAITERAKLSETLVLLDKELAMRTQLAAKGYQSQVVVYQLQQVRVERVRNIELQEAAAAKARAAIAGIDQQLRERREALAKGGLTTLAKADDEAGLRREEIVKADRRSALLQIRAPMDGTVEQLQVNTIGGAVEPARPLMTIVPSGGALVAEARIENRDIGFVHVGQDVAVKVEAFPFTDYGLLHGRVTSIGRDAVATGEADKPGAPVFVVRIRLDRTAVTVGDCSVPQSPNCREIPLGPGMALQAEIRTGRRRIIEYLLSPLRRAVSEAGRER